MQVNNITKALSNLPVQSSVITGMRNIGELQLVKQLGENAIKHGYRVISIGNSRNMYPMVKQNHGTEIPVNSLDYAINILQIFRTIPEARGSEAVGSYRDALSRVSLIAKEFNPKLTEKDLKMLRYCLNGLYAKYHLSPLTTKGTVSKDASIQPLNHSAKDYPTLSNFTVYLSKVITKNSKRKKNHNQDFNRRLTAQINSIRRINKTLDTIISLYADVFNHHTKSIFNGNSNWINIDFSYTNDTNEAFYKVQYLNYLASLANEIQNSSQKLYVIFNDANRFLDNSDVSFVVKNLNYLRVIVNHSKANIEVYDLPKLKQNSQEGSFITSRVLLAGNMLYIFSLKDGQAKALGELINNHYHKHFQIASAVNGFKSLTSYLALSPKYDKNMSVKSNVRRPNMEQSEISKPIRNVNNSISNVNQAETNTATSSSTNSTQNQGVSTQTPKSTTNNQQANQTTNNNVNTTANNNKQFGDFNINNQPVNHRPQSNINPTNNNSFVNNNNRNNQQQVNNSNNNGSGVEMNSNDIDARNIQQILRQPYSYPKFGSSKISTKQFWSFNNFHLISELQPEVKKVGNNDFIITYHLIGPKSRIVQCELVNVSNNGGTHWLLKSIPNSTFMHNIESRITRAPSSSSIQAFNNYVQSMAFNYQLQQGSNGRFFFDLNNLKGQDNGQDVLERSLHEAFYRLIGFEFLYTNVACFDLLYLNN